MTAATSSSASSPNGETDMNDDEVRECAGCTASWQPPQGVEWHFEWCPWPMERREFYEIIGRDLP